MNEKKELSFLIEVLSWCISLIVILLISFLLYGEDDSSIFIFFFVVIPLAIGLMCAYKNSKWAKEINKSKNVAYIIGYLFGLVGLVGYFVYYTTRLPTSIFKKENWKLK